MTTAPSRRIEDVSFPYAGYARATVDQLHQGDGVRFHDVLHTACMLVEATNPVGGEVDLILTDRTVAVAVALADSLHRPFEGMADDAGLTAVRLPADTECWIRL